MFCIYSLIRSPILIGLEIDLNKIDNRYLCIKKKTNFEALHFHKLFAIKRNRFF